MKLGLLSNCIDSENVSIEQFRLHPIVTESRLQQLALAYSVAPRKGHVLEFGVYKGESINFIAGLAGNRKIFGFDSFCGLPEDWERAENDVYEKGHFRLSALPDVPQNVSLIEGFFEETLDEWVSDNPEDIAFLHIDCDLYSSASYVLNTLKSKIVPGTIIVFDELSNWNPNGVYKNWKQGEWRALIEFLRENDIHARILSRDKGYSAALQVIDINDEDSHHCSNYALGLWKCGFREEAVDLQRDVIDGRDDVDYIPLIARYLGWELTLGKVESVLNEINEHIDNKEYLDQYLPLYRVKSRALFLSNKQEEAKEFTRGYINSCIVDHRDWSALGNILYSLRDYKDALIAYQHASNYLSNDAYKERIAECQWRKLLRPDFRSLTFSALILQEIIDRFDFKTVLDIGSGAGKHAEILASYDKKVTRIDLGASKYYQSAPVGQEQNIILDDFMDHEFHETFDCIWASHVLEHQPNVNSFLVKIKNLLVEGGVLAITVPPLKEEVVGGHVTLWNAGLLLYNLVLAGFDCSEAVVRSYGYNISVAIKKRSITLPKLSMDKGDVDLLSRYLPKGLSEGFNGNLKDVN